MRVSALLQGWVADATEPFCVRHHADVVLRMNLTNLPLEDPQGQPLVLLPRLRMLEIGQAADWSAWMRDDEGVIAVRVCAYKKTCAQTLAAQAAIWREATKNTVKSNPKPLRPQATLSY